MDKKKLKRSAIFAALWLIVLAITLTASTFAWFTLTNTALVNPMEGRISNEGVSLYISNSPNGPFDTSCTLILTADPETIRPVTTTDLVAFRIPKAQDEAGNPTSYRDLGANFDKSMLHGFVYLTAKDNLTHVFLVPDELGLTRDAKLLSSLRLGLKISCLAGEYTYILEADSRQQLGQELFVIRSGEVATVEYFLYMEGTDPDCTNAVSSKDLDFCLVFEGAL